MGIFGNWHEWTTFTWLIFLLQILSIGIIPRSSFTFQYTTECLIHNFVHQIIVTNFQNFSTKYSPCNKENDVQFFQTILHSSKWTEQNLFRQPVSQNLLLSWTLTLFNFKWWKSWMNVELLSTMFSKEYFTANSSNKKSCRVSIFLYKRSFF